LTSESLRKFTEADIADEFPVDTVVVCPVKLTDNAQKTAMISEYFILNDFTKMFPKTGVYVSILLGLPEAFSFLRTT
jgi:hypothetical protein